MFIRKIDRNLESPHIIMNEVMPIINGKGEGFLNHDNVVKSSINIWTEPDRGGVQITTYTVEVKNKYPWRFYLKVNVDYLNVDKVYINYESYGDQVEAKDVNELQEGIEKVVFELDTHKERNEIHLDGVIDGGTF